MSQRRANLRARVCVKNSSELVEATGDHALAIAREMRAADCVVMRPDMQQVWRLSQRGFKACAVNPFAFNVSILQPQRFGMPQQRGEGVPLFLAAQSGRDVQSHETQPALLTFA